ncbi:MAG TPA: hypothetical protein VJ385_06255 [Fibrobacteria bacterium]|nr:hypothetical protein [Fibrobacteria bacterium]
MKPRGELGLTVMEALVAGSLGLMLVLLAHMLFRSQMLNFNDMGSQVQLQAKVRQAMQGMTKEIANTGACLKDNRRGFAMGPDRLGLSYVDVSGRHCPAWDTVTVTFQALRGGEGSALVKDIACASGARNRQVLVEGGGIALAFTYRDRQDRITADPRAVRAVEFTVALASEGRNDLFRKTRLPQARVQLVN